MTMLHHTGLTISDLDRSLRFWRDAMGMQVLFQQEKKGGYLETIVGEPGAHVRMAHLAFDGEGPRIELFEYLAPAGGRHTQRPADVGFAHVCVACDDIEERLERLVAAGGEAITGPVTIDTGANAGGRGLYLRDPDGHVVELFERPRGGGADARAPENTERATA
jgi:catechol 2,3-dioxygenase-like lactoylglutathione lyase family enzyme